MVNPRPWPAGVPNHTLTDVATAFGISRVDARAHFSSQATTDSISALVAWKTKYSTTQAPSLAHLIEKYRVPAGQQSSEKLPEYLSLLETFVDDSREFFALGPNNPVSIEDIRDAHRLLSCASRQATRYPPPKVAATPLAAQPAAVEAIAVSTRSTSSIVTSNVVKPRRNIASASAHQHRRNLEASPPRRRPRLQVSERQPEPVIEKRVDLHTVWDNPPPEIPPAAAQKFLPNIQLVLQRWADFEYWIEINYGIAGSGLRTTRYLAHTAPSEKPFTRFDLTDFDLTEDSWECALSTASRTGLLMVAFETTPIVPAVLEPESTASEVSTVGAALIVPNVLESGSTASDVLTVDAAPIVPAVLEPESTASEVLTVVTGHMVEANEDKNKNEIEDEIEDRNGDNNELKDEDEDGDIDMEDKDRSETDDRNETDDRYETDDENKTEDRNENETGAKKQFGWYAKGNGIPSHIVPSDTLPFKDPSKPSVVQIGTWSDSLPGMEPEEDDDDCCLAPDIEILKSKKQSTFEPKPVARPEVLLDVGPNVEFFSGTNFDRIVLGETGEDARTKEGADDAEPTVSSVEWLHKIMDNEIFQRDNLSESFAALDVDPVTRRFPLINPNFRFMDHQIVGINWMKEQEQSLAGGGLLADDCGTGKTMTTIGLMCHAVHTYENWMVEQDLTMEHYQRCLRAYNESKKNGTPEVANPDNPEYEFMGPTLIICPVPMITEWEEAIRTNSSLIPFLHYGTSFFDSLAWNSIKFASKYPWRYVIITTKETLLKRWNKLDSMGNKFWGTTSLPLERLVLDEGHRLRSSGNRIGSNFNPQTGVTTKVDSSTPAIVLAKQLDSLNPSTKWMLTATPLVNGLTDLRWVCRFLQRREWYSENLPPDTFANRHDVETGLWEPNNRRRSEDGNHHDSIFTRYANPFANHAYHGSYVHCTTMSWDVFIAFDLEKSFKVQFQQKSRPLTEDERNQVSERWRIAGERAKEILRTLILRRSMVSRIPFKTGEPIINIPVMNTVTTRLRFSDDSSRNLYSFLIDNFSRMQKSFASPTGSAIPGHRFSPRWRYIRLVSLSPLLAYGSFVKSFSVPELFDPNESDQGLPHRTKVKQLLAKFHGEFPDKAHAFYPSSVASMSDAAMVRAMEFGSPKLGRVRNRLHELVIVKKQKVILWAYWPLSQWLLQEFVRLLGISCYAVHSGLDVKNRERIKTAFNKSPDIDVLVLSYLCSNEGINLHYQCHNTMMVEQGLSYSAEHQAWSRVRRIGQTKEQHTERLVNLETIDVLIERAQRERQSPMLYAFGIMEQLGGTADTDQVFDALVGKIPPAVLRDQTIGRGGDDSIDLE